MLMQLGRWAKSSFSNGNGGNNCVEVQRLVPLRTPTLTGGVAVRHSKNPDLGALTFTVAEWRAFVAGVKNGEFDV